MNERTAPPPLTVSVMPVTDFQQNASLITCTATQQAVMVDPGGEAQKIIAAIQKARVTLSAIWLTHGHIDHVGGASEVAQRFGVPIIGPERSDESLIAGVAEQAKMFGVPGIVVPYIDQWLKDGDQVTVGTQTFDVLHTPGHSPGHVIFVHPRTKFIVMGDVLFRGSIGRTDLPGADHATLMKSIFQTVLPLGDDYQFLPGHGPGSTLGDEKQTNPFLVDGFES